MELPHLGKQCMNRTCNQLGKLAELLECGKIKDYLPLKCDACGDIFCQEHVGYVNHDCRSAYKKDVQVPVCPLCNIPIPVKRGELPDITVGAHIDSDCQSDPAKNRRKVFVNKCSVKSCRGKEVVAVICNDCKLNFCLKHRHPTDHKCEGAQGAARRRAAEAAVSRQSQTSGATSNSKGVPKPSSHQPPRGNSRPAAFSSVQGQMSEDEALARALALSLQDSTEGPSKASVDEDQMLARAIAESERMSAPSSKNSCNVT